MSTKTSQLQIRISPEQKVALKRLAADAGKSVSAYVLATVLPATDLEFAHKVRAVRSSGDRPKSLSDLYLYLSGLVGADFAATVRDVDLDGFPGLLQNLVAGLVEDEARTRGVAAPSWAESVDGPARPHFAWDLRSLRPHLLRLTPAVYKRRNVYALPSGRIRMTQRHTRDLAPLLDLTAGLESEGVIAEFCVVGGAVITIAFQANPVSRRVRHLFAASATVDAIVETVTRQHELPHDWLTNLSRELVSAGGRYGGLYENPNLRIFSARPDYVLAARLAAIPFEPEEHQAARIRSDVRHLLRVTDAIEGHHARALVAPFFTERQLPEDVDSRLSAALVS